MQKQSPLKNRRQRIRLKSEEPQIDLQASSKYKQYAFLTASLLRDLIEQQTSEQQQQTPFDSTILKNIDLQTYISSIHKQTSFEPQCLILALIYIDRYNLQSEDFVLTWTNIHKLLLVCILLATKFHDQVYYDNKAFEIGGGVNNVKLVELEIKVFQKLQFNLFVKDQYFFEFLDSLHNAYLAKDNSSDTNSIENTNEEV